MWVGYDINNMRRKNEKLDFDSCKELLYKIIKDKLNVSKEELLSKKRHRVLADARRALMKILKTKFPYTKVTVLGETVKRDHSSASIQLRNHDELIEYKNDYSDLFHLINDEFYNLAFNTYQSLQDLYDIKKDLETKLKTIDLLIHELENKKDKDKIIEK